MFFISRAIGITIASRDVIGRPSITGPQGASLDLHARKVPRAFGKGISHSAD
jgi:hypothetical protein